MANNQQSGSNTASNDSAADWMRQYRTQKRICEEHNGVLRNVLKRAKADGINTKSMIEAVKGTKLEPDVVQTDLRDTMRYMAIARIPLNREALFDWSDVVTEKTSHEDDLWDAGDKGYRAGRHGVKPEDAPYMAGTELHVLWLAQWHKGQAAIANELGPDVRQADATRKRPARADDEPRLSIVPDAPAKKRGRGPAKPYMPGQAKRGRRAASLN